jgi:hypothetical protein
LGEARPLDLGVLSPGARATLELLGVFTLELGFYLGGGTAIALYLSHRRSVDLDWFRAQPFDAAAVGRGLLALGATVDQVTIAEGTLHAQVGGTAVSFLEYRYPNLVDPQRVRSPEFLLASLDDLACMKLGALLQRGERKDYFDLYALLDRGYTLEGLAFLFERKFGFEATSSLARAVVYFDDAEASPDPVALWPGLTWQRVKDGLRAAMRAFAG